MRLCVGAPSTGVGWRLIASVLGAATGASDEETWEATRRLGDLGDAANELLSKRTGERPSVSSEEVRELFDRLPTATRRGKALLLTNFLARTTPLEATYVIKALLGEVRTGALEGVVLAAIAKAFGADLEDVRRAHALVGDAEETAALAHAGRLGTARLVPGRPVLPMLATPIEASKAPIDWQRVVVEDKLDGIRAQLHVAGGVVSIFGRGQGSITGSFPDVVRALGVIEHELVLDGEILAVSQDGGPRPFQSLQARLGRVAPDDALLEEVPVAFIAFDVLFAGEALMDRPWSARREALEKIGVRRSPYERVTSPADLEAAFARARARGHEGVMLKRIDAPYEAGSRGASWLKVKKATATLDVVVTAVEQGHGKRAGVISDYTFAVWRGDELVDVGKAYSGLTDAEIKTLGERFERTTLERRGGWRRVEPTLVLEVAFDGIQRSKRHPSGFALRFPRIARIRDDKPPEQADSIEAVERLFASQVESGHREDTAPAPKRTKKKKPAPDRDQLSLFDDPPKPPRTR